MVQALKKIMSVSLRRSAAPPRLPPPGVRGFAGELELPGRDSGVAGGGVSGGGVAGVDGGSSSPSPAHSSFTKTFHEFHPTVNISLLWHA
jgi:hypothetical protein